MVSKLATIATAIVVSLAAAAPARAQVSLSVNVGTPPVFVAAPQLVVVPGSSVYYAPGSDNIFFYSGRYYTQFNGAWFYAPRPGAAWVSVSVVPQPLLAVPVQYYRVPPGHAKGYHCPPGQAKKGRC